MKKIFILILLGAVLTGCSNDDDNDNDDKAVYTVTFDADGGSPVPAAQTVKAGDNATAPAVNPSKAGYVFMFWHLNGSAVAYNFQTPVGSDITLTAKWTSEGEDEEGDEEGDDEEGEGEGDEEGEGEGGEEANTFTIRNTADWTAAIDVIKKAKKSSYTLTIEGTVSVPPTTDVQENNAASYTFGTYEYITVTLAGSGTLALNGKGFLIYIRGWEYIYSKGYQKLIIDGPTLQGIADNNVPLLFISTYGSLELKSGKITGNTNNGGDGGLNYGSGVRLDKESVFIMSGGEISGNTCASDGGGVYMLGASSFTMEGGEISGNTSSDGGGVAYNGSGYGKEAYFIMTGGVIRGNTASGPSYPGGGGVRLMSSSILRKTGGIIYGSDAAEADKNRVVDSRNGREYRSRGAAVAHYVGNVVEAVGNKYRETTLGENDDLSTKSNDGWGM